MTDNNHPINPPPELVEQWRKSGPADAAVNNAYERHIATQAARWGADQELEACCEWLRSSLPGYDKHYADCLRDARRPKPPSLKEQALLQLDTLNADLGMHGLGCDLSQIRRALESLPD